MMTSALAALHAWSEEHPFLAHWLGPPTSALGFFILVIGPWWALDGGMPALTIAQVPPFSVHALVVATGVFAILCLCAQWIMLSSGLSWRRVCGSLLALFSWPVLFFIVLDMMEVAV